MTFDRPPRSRAARPSSCVRKRADRTAELSCPRSLAEVTHADRSRHAPKACSTHRQSASMSTCSSVRALIASPPRPGLPRSRRPLSPSPSQHP